MVRIKPSAGRSSQRTADVRGHNSVMSPIVMLAKRVSLREGRPVSTSGNQLWRGHREAHHGTMEKQFLQLRHAR